MTEPLADGIPGLGEDTDDDNSDDEIGTHEFPDPAANGDSPADPATDEVDGTAEPSDDTTEANDDAGEVDDETAEEEVEPVEVLVGLAEDGEIDPWDIDIVEVTDAFLSRLDEQDLRTSGRALFYASVLLRMKGDELFAPEEPDEPPEPEPWEAAMNGGGEIEQGPNFDPVTALEAEMDRRLDRQSTRGSPETLDELVRDLREAERGTWWKESREYDTSGSPSGFDRGTQTLDYHASDDVRLGGEPREGDVTGATHQEDIEDVIEDVREALGPHYEAGREEVLFAEIDDVGGTAVTTFLALLFLANRGEIRLQQDDLFGDLWIQDESVATVGEEAIAD